MLRFYSYYKQAIEGPCQQSKPAFWEVVKKAKWDAWTRLGNMSRTEAMNNYVEELKKVNMDFYNETHFKVNVLNENHYCVVDCRNNGLYG